MNTTQSHKSQHTHNGLSGIRSLLPLLLLPLLFSSCEKMFTHEFNPKGKLEDHGKILIESILENHLDTLKIRAGVATALRNDHTVDASLLDMKLKINGKEIEMYEDTHSPKQFINQKNFYALQQLQSKDVIELYAEAPEIEPASSKVTMGADIPTATFTTSLEWTDKTQWGHADNTKNRCRKITITLDEEPQANSLFGVQVIKRLEVVGHDDHIVVGGIGTHYNVDSFVDLYTLESSDYPMSGRHYDLCGTFNDADMQIFDDYYVNDEGKMCFDVYVYNDPFQRFSETLYIQPKYKIILSRLSPELYNQIEKSGGVEGLWELGIGPHAHSYTNINGGVGLLATKNNYVSDWILIPEKDEN